jgi:cyanophycinase
MQSPKGFLIAVGGAEDKGVDAGNKRLKSVDFFTEGILKNIAQLAGKKSKPVIEIITTASVIPDEVAMQYKRAFRHLDGIECGHLKITTREEAEDKKMIEKLEKANCILLSGGNQLKLCSILGGTTFHDVMREKYQSEHFVIAGTSAGAAAMSNTMISGGKEDKAYLKGELELSLGLGFLQEVIIDSHFDARGRFGRLTQAIAAQPGAIGIGLDEDTAVIVEKGNRLKAIGASSVVIVDGSSITHNNIVDIKDGTPLSVANLQVNIMRSGDTYEINSRKFIPRKS